FANLRAGALDRTTVGIRQVERERELCQAATTASRERGGTTKAPVDTSSRNSIRALPRRPLSMSLAIRPTTNNELARNAIMQYPPATIAAIAARTVVASNNCLRVNCTPSPPAKEPRKH